MPGAGDSFLVVDEDRVARQIAERRSARERNAELAQRRGRGLARGPLQVPRGGQDRDRSTSSSRATSPVRSRRSRTRCSSIDVGEEVSLRVIDRGVGAITQNDVNLAVASSAVILGFNVRPAERVGELADREGVDVRYYSVIYQAIDEIEAALKGMLKPEFEEAQLGTAEVREVFRSSKFGNIAGSPGPLGHDRPQRQGPADPRRRRGRGEPHDRLAASGSRTTRPRSARASSAASASARSTTSRSDDVIETYELREKPRA